MKKYLHIKPPDWIVIIYLLITTLLVIIFRNEIRIWELLIFIRIIAFVFILLITRDFKSKCLTFIQNFYPYAFAAYFYGETGYFNTLFSSPFDEYLMNADQFIFGFQPAVVFSQIFHWQWFSEWMFFSYFSFYFFVFGIPLLYYLKKPDKFEYVSFVFLFSFYAYYTFFVVFPSVGPQFFYTKKLALIETSGFFAEIMKLIQHYGETPTGAFPSSHIGISWLSLYFAKKYNSKLFWILLTFVFALTCSTVYIKAHYFVDVIGGAISFPILFWISNGVHKYFTKKTKRIWKLQ